MKKDLERYRDKLTPEEERRVWSKMRDGLREGESRWRSWAPHLWLSRAAVAAVVVLAAAVIWHADLLTPERALKKNAPVFDARTKAGAGAGSHAGAGAGSHAGEDEGPQAGAKAERERALQAGEQIGGPAETPVAPAGEAGVSSAGQAEGDHPQVEKVEPQAESSPEAAGAEATPRSDASPGEAEGGGAMMKVPPEMRVFDKAQGAAVSKGKEAGEPLTNEAKSPPTRELPEEAPRKRRGLMPLNDYNEAEEGAAATAEAGGEIRGRVTDDRGNPLSYADVLVVGTRFGAMTDDAGYFRIRNLPAGTYTLNVELMGYDIRTIPDVVVEKGATKDVAELELKETSVEGEDSTRVPGRAAAIHVKRSSAAASLQADRLMSAPLMEQSVTGVASPLMAPPRKRRYPSLTGGRRPVNEELADDMFFRHYGTNPFIDAEEDALSTFALDVDTGSYTICRRYINEGSLPPPEAVRVEEFVNFFPKDFPPPRRGDFAIYLDGMPSPFAQVRDGSYWLLRVGIRGRVIDDRHRKPAQIVLVIDTSGSMGMGPRLPLLKESMKLMLDELRADDEIGIVEFGTQARVVLPLTPLSEEREIYRATPLSEEGEIYRAIDSLIPNGSTNAEDGLKLGYRMMRKGARAGRLHRIIFCSDGVANVGNTGWQSILESVRRDSDDISLSTIGFGMGNYNDVLMEQLADAGDGQYAYVDDMREAKRVLRENLTGTLQTIAKDARAQIEFNPKHVAKYRLLGYENRDVRDEDFRDDEVDAGEIGAGHEVTVLYEVKLKSRRGRGRIAKVHLRHERPEGGEIVEMEESMGTRDLWREIKDAPPDLVVDACVAEFAEILRHSYWAKDGSLEDVLDLLDETTETMTSRPELDELMRLVEKAVALQDGGERPRRVYREQ